MAKENTPLEDILFDKPNLRERAINLCEKYHIRTAEQLATYNRFLFRTLGNRRLPEPTGDFNEKTITYLEKCLRRVGLSFSPEPVGGPQYKVYGNKNTENDLISAMSQLKDYQTANKINRTARKKLMDQLEPYEFYKGEKLFTAWSFASSVFKTKRIAPLLEALVKEKKAERKIIKGKPHYRLKQP